MSSLADTAELVRTDGMSESERQSLTPSVSPFVTIKGMWAAKIWIVLPALVGLLIMFAFGEGDYIVPKWAMLWSACFVIGLRIRARAEKGTVRRSQGFGGASGLSGWHC